jgi:hypothetical protein
MTITKKAARASEAELLAAFEPYVQPSKGDAGIRAFYGEGIKNYKPHEFADAVAKMVNKWDRKMRQHRKRLLCELANIPEASKFPIRHKHTAQLFGIESLPAEALQRTKGTLQYIWPRDVEPEKKQAVVQLLLSVAIDLPNHGGVFAPLLSQQLEFHPKNFLGQVVIGVLENWPTMAKCENPDCVVPYFLAKRNTQKYCERGECTRYALRKKAREHWRKKHGKSTEGGEA